LALAVLPWPPVSWILDWNHTLKAAWVSSPELEPPYGHAEESSLAGLARRQGLDLTQAEQRLAERGWQYPGPQASLAQIAALNGVRPMDVYAEIRNEPAPAAEPLALGSLTLDEVEARYSGTGLGRKSLETVCAELGLDLDAARARLAEAGVEAQAEETLRPVADRYGLSPIDLLKILLVEGYRPLR
jgi:hypothetical protein